MQILLSTVSAYACQLFMICSVGIELTESMHSTVNPR